MAYVLMNRRFRFYKSGRWVPLKRAARFDKQLAGDLFRNISAVKEMLTEAQAKKVAAEYIGGRTPRKHRRVRRNRRAR